MTSQERGVKALAALAIAAFLIGFSFIPCTPQGMPLPLMCPFKNMTGLPCPLCGGTRAAHALLHGELGRAIYLNPLALPAIAFCVMAGLVLAYEAVRGVPLANWPAVFHRLGSLMPLGLAILMIWWLPHIYLALRTPKLELLELRNPIAHAIYMRVGPPVPPIGQ